MSINLIVCDRCQKDLRENNNYYDFALNCGGCDGAPVYLCEDCKSIVDEFLKNTKSDFKPLEEDHTYLRCDRCGGDAEDDEGYDYGYSIISHRDRGCVLWDHTRLCGDCYTKLCEILDDVKRGDEK